MLETKKFFIKTQGCQMNEYDSDKLGDILKHNLNMVETDKYEEADLLFLNTCSIREKAQEKVFHQLGRWKKLKNKNPNILIAVGGCVASQEGKKLRSRSPQVDIIFGPQTIHRLPKMIKEVYSSQTKTAIDVSFPEIEKFDYLPSSNKKTPSAYLSIMEGCSKYCTFCVVPYTRGEEVNRRFDDILFEASLLSKKGTRELVLLGQNVNAYKSTKNNGDMVGLAELIRHISYIDGIERIRHTTSHPIDFSDDLIDEYRNPKLANNLHLPVQSGSDIILSKMKRKHTVLEFKRIIKKVREIRPDINLTSDFIVGYPGETDYDFQQTLNLIEDLKFSDAYSFIYSARPGTPASYETDGVKMETKIKRLKKLKDLIKKQSAEFSKNMVGRKETVLVEGISVKRDSELFGRSNNNKIINFAGPKNLIGQFVDIKITELRTNTLHGNLLENRES
ncbi:MAG: tRNA (N6-isopentenyl adenosine(37)-C2)-methylthiotransferase MiaB [Pelagibacterales bacterium]|nr:tRNA (N6-isopentenyl adenosine(37)-C2)-methylthiotransferase MiaB [Pelagibacterales bacterium]